MRSIDSRSRTGRKSSSSSKSSKALLVVGQFVGLVVVASLALALAREHDAVLLDSKVEGGFTYGHVEPRFGARSLYQHRAQSFVGPVASLAVRL